VTGGNYKTLERNKFKKETKNKNYKGDRCIGRFLVMVGGSAFCIAMLSPLGCVALFIGRIIVVVTSDTLQNRKAELSHEYTMESIKLRHQINISRISHAHTVV